MNARIPRKSFVLLLLAKDPKIKNQKLSVLLLLLFVVLFSVACGGVSTATSTPTSTPLPTIPPTAVRPTPDINVYLQMDLGEGDPQHGSNVAIAHGCQLCHAGVHLEKGPRFTATDDLPPIPERGELRIADPAYEGQATTNQEYLLESIFIPEAYIAPGEWAVTKPVDFDEKIKKEDLPHLLAWLATFNELAAEPTAAPLPTETAET